MTWYHNGEEVTEIPPNILAFVYTITNIATGRMYIGLKQTTFASLVL